MSSKINFLLNEFPASLEKLSPDQTGLFGKMNAMQMIEHMSDSVRIANGKDQFPLHTPADKVEAMQNFVRSEKEFRPNTKNALMKDEPEPVRNADMQRAIAELKNELNDFRKKFEDEKVSTILNPFFGELDYELWTQLLYKHARHHMRQFGLIE